MMAHVIYEKVDPVAAGFSSHWIQGVLREQLGFQGVIFSDDLNMAGAEIAGNFSQRAAASLEAGCDMLLVCNNPEGADEVLDSLQEYNNPVSQLRLVRLHGRAVEDRNLFHSKKWYVAIQRLEEFKQMSELAQGDDLFEES
jgi:beta-N-acetylhexosaminidase